MKITCEDWTESTTPELLPVIRCRFDDEACGLIDLILSNPLRKLRNSVGDIAYIDGKIASFQATILRRLYFNGREVIGSCGSMLCKTDDNVPPEAVLVVMQQSGSPKYGCRLYYGNTASPVSSKLNCVLRAQHGPDSWMRTRYYVPHWRSFIFYLFRHIILHNKIVIYKKWVPPMTDEAFVLPDENGFQLMRETAIDIDRLNDFWVDVKDALPGIVSSRAPEELEWLFGDRLKSNRCIMLSANKGRKMFGYIIIGSGSANAMRWTIADLIAKDNDLDVMRALLEAAKHFLRNYTPAMLFEITGFPDFVQPLLKREFPFVRAAVPNQFIWKFNDKQLKSEVEGIANTEQSWFFGPYDGDKCMCC